MLNRDAILPIAVGFFFLIVALILLPDFIAKCRRVKIQPSCEFGGESEDLIVAAIFFPMRLYEALTAKPLAPDDRPQAIKGTGTNGVKSEGNEPQKKLDVDES